MARDFVPPLVMCWCGLPLLNVVLLRFVGQGCAPVSRDSGWQAVSETSRHGNCAREKVPCGESEDERGKVGPAHREVAGKGLAEDLVELSLNESNESGRNDLLHRHLCLEERVHLFVRHQECCKLEYCRVALLRTNQDCHHDEPLLKHIGCRLPADYGWDVMLFN